MYEIERYKSENGECPFDEFIGELKKHKRLAEIKKINFYIERLQEQGMKILTNPSYAKKIENNLYELRPEPNRVIFCYCQEKEKFILLHCFRKKSKKTPECEIDKARNEMLKSSIEGEKYGGD